MSASEDYRRCTGCDRLLPVEKFPPDRYYPDGRFRQRHCRCRGCVAAYTRAWKAKSKDKLTASKRRYQERVKADEERRLGFMLNERFRKRDNGSNSYRQTTVIEAYRPIDGDDYVPSGPFLDWISKTFANGLPLSLLAHIGYDSKIYSNFSISLSRVDAVLTKGLGRADLVERLYPYEKYGAGMTRAQLYEMEAAELEAMDGAISNAA